MDKKLATITRLASVCQGIEKFALKQIAPNQLQLFRMVKLLSERIFLRPLLTDVIQTASVMVPLKPSHVPLVGSGPLLTSVVKNETTEFRGSLRIDKRLLVKELCLLI